MFKVRLLTPLIMFRYLHLSPPPSFLLRLYHLKNLRENIRIQKLVQSCPGHILFGPPENTHPRPRIKADVGSGDYLYFLTTAVTTPAILSSLFGRIGL